MTVQENATVRTLVDVESWITGATWPAGTVGTVVDVTGELISVDVGDDTTGFDHIDVRPGQFDVVES